MGVQQVEVRAPADYCTVDNLVRIRETVEAAGLELFEVMRSDRYNSEAIALGLPGRDAEMERLRQFLRDLGRAGIDTTTYAWHTGGVYATGSTTTRGCRTRLFELADALARPNAYDREYSDDELWENYERFIREILPVAEEAGVRLQLHPNDPPVTHQGVARIFRSTGAFARAMDLAAHSDHSGILFCVGTWGQMTGADGSGEDVVAAIRDLGSRGHIYQVHFRNVSSTLPDFHETFPEDGYLDMYAIMKALAEVGFDGMVVPDHVPVCEESEEPRTQPGASKGALRTDPTARDSAPHAGGSECTGG
jgi:mannonate dehydratase